MHRFGGDRLDRAAVAAIRGQPGHQQVHPAVDDGGHRDVLGERGPQHPFDLGAGGLDHGSGQFLFAARKVVIQRPGLDAGVVENLVQASRGVALAAEQGACGLDQRGAAAVGAGHTLDNTRKIVQQSLRRAARAKRKVPMSRLREERRQKCGN